MKKLPIGIQSFVKMREGNYYYVDKTRFVKELAEEGGYFFLSRPRRFGKSLFLDTLRQAFLGRRELFRGLYLEDNWDWDIKHPVVYISFGSGVLKEREHLLKLFESIIKRQSEKEGIILREELPQKRFEELIIKLSEKYDKKVVVLIDEYDKPILDNIEDRATAIEMRETLKNFYSVLKDADLYLQFVFITGVSKFSKVSLFSGLNNLNDITLDPRYSTICGYTQSEFEEVFADRLRGVDLEEVRRWYNGYSWLGEPVYNPFDVLLFLDKKDFRPYWFETGTPTFLIKLLVDERYYIPALESLEASDEIVESFDVEDISAETLLFQTGYLTIESVEKAAGMSIYRLRYPNLEVKSAFTRHLLTYLVRDRARKNRNLISLYRLLTRGDVEGLMEVFKSFFSSIPGDWYRRSEIRGYEGYYASIFYCYFTALGIDVRAEDATSAGRIDMSAVIGDICYIFEFKVVELEPKGKALEQIKEKRYHEKYLSRCRTIYLVGVEFSREKRNIVGFEWERVGS